MNLILQQSPEEPTKDLTPSGVNKVRRGECEGLYPDLTPCPFFHSYTSRMGYCTRKTTCIFEFQKMVGVNLQIPVLKEGVTIQIEIKG